MSINGWQSRTIGELLASSLPGDWGKESNPEQGTPVLRSTNFGDDGSIDYTDIAFRSVTKARLEKRRIGVGTILIEKAGGSSTRPAGRVVYCDRQFNGTASNFVEVIHVKDDYSAKFVFYRLYFNFHVGLVSKYQQQTTGIINFKWREYCDELIELPDTKAEQYKIAEVLSSLDRAIEQTEASIAKQERIKTGLMQDLLTRGIDDHGNLRSESTHPFRETPSGRIPRDWWIASVGELFEQRSERGRPGLPVMSIVMNDGLVERTSVERRVQSNLPAEGHALVLKGDIAYNMMRMWQGVLGRALFDCLVSPAYVVLKPRESIDTCFAEWLFRDRRSILKFRRSSRGVVDDRLRLYADDLFPIKFAIPKSLDEQRVIAQRIEAMKTHITKETAVLEKFRRLRVGLMQDLLTGKRRVTSLLDKTLVASA